MAILHNKIDKRILKEQLAKEEFKRITLSFYKYAHIVDPTVFRDELFKAWNEWRIFGRVYVAKEGINGQIAVPEMHFEAFKTHLYAYEFLSSIRLNIAIEDDGKSFYKLKIKVRDKIVADGIEDEQFDVTKGGKHLDAEEFNALTEQEDTIIVDMRNHYESEVGHFENAICPDVDTFRDSLPIIEDMLEEHKEKNIVMYCTGGIRCEKASAYYKHKGFQNVFQLNGGIIEYTRQVKEKELPNKFKGKNFVFDDRLGERISQEIISECHQCGAACDTHTNCANDACHLLFIQCENCATQYEGCCTEACQEFIHLSEEEQKERRKGMDNGQQIFKKYQKGRIRPKLKDLK